MPLVADGVLYYSGSYSRVLALDGATGKPLWSYIPKLNEDLVAARRTRRTTAASRSATARSTWAPSTAG